MIRGGTDDILEHKWISIMISLVIASLLFHVVMNVYSLAQRNFGIFVVVLLVLGFSGFPIAAVSLLVVY